MFLDFFIIVIFNLYVPGSHQAKDITIKYVCKVNTLETDIREKTAMNRVTVVNGDTISTEPDSIFLNDIFKRISFEQNFSITVTPYCSFTTFGENTLADGIHLNSPDTIKYCGGEWISVKKGRETIMPFKEMSIEKTKEIRTILGYHCSKFTARNITNKEEYIIWASKQLPPTLIPVSGTKAFGYGILEIYETNDKWSVVASDISR